MLLIWENSKIAHMCEQHEIMLKATTWCKRNVETCKSSCSDQEGFVLLSQGR